VDTTTGTFTAATGDAASDGVVIQAPAAPLEEEMASDTVEAAARSPQEGGRPTHLRLREETEEAPHLGRMVAMSACAALLALLGMVVAIRTFVAIVLDAGPGWVVPVVMTLGVAGTVCAGLAFATVHHKRLPWQLLGAASLLLAVNLILVTTAL
jgi:hypothetical protein